MECTPIETSSLRGRTAPPCSVMMTRCECAGLTFGELLAQMRAERLSVSDACRRTGCGQLCTACLPDLESYLAAGA